MFVRLRQAQPDKAQQYYKKECQPELVEGGLTEKL